jgi:hypothetical protein
VFNTILARYREAIATFSTREAAGGLMGASIGLGITSKQAKADSQQISKGSLLLVVEGTTREIDRARHLLKQS